MKEIILLFLLGLLLLQQSFITGGAAAAATDITTDQSALFALKAQVSASGAENVLHSNWTTSATTSVCDWIGVTCGSNHQRVIALNISFMSLTGRIPPEIGNLSFLVSLDLRENNFHGDLPQEMAHLRRLQVLDLRLNNFSGRIPSWFGYLTQLQYLDLGSNNFSSFIPDSVFNLSKLETLSFTSNSIQGNIPATVGNLTKLQQLILASNKLSGAIPREMGNLHSLEVLSLSVNSFSGSIPSEIFNISSLKVLFLYYNQLSGHLPSNMGSGLPSLEMIQLNDNYLDGVIPDSISNASRLTEIQFSNNSFIGPIPTSLGSLKFLNCLHLYKNYLHNSPSVSELSIITSLTNCRLLTDLSIGENPLNGILPASIGNLSASLSRLNIGYAQLRGSIPNEIGNLSSLISLSLSSNDLTGSVPIEFQGLKRLQGLFLIGNRIQGLFPESICKMESLAGLHLGMNQLFGPIPECIGNMTSLTNLRLQSNNFSSTIPMTLWSLPKLLILDLSSNILNGNLPLQNNILMATIYLDLSINQLSGEIPRTFGSLQSLITLNLSQNQLQGSIPDELGNITALQDLNLSFNDLSGVIPRSLEGLNNLRYFNVSFNKLSGQIPTAGPFQSFTSSSFMSNDGLCDSLSFKVPSCRITGSHRSRKLKVLLIVLIPLALVSVFLAVGIVFLIVRRRKAKRLETEEDTLTESERVSYYDILQATNKFSGENLLGSGGFGSVYKGHFTDGKVLAIKVFARQSEGTFKSFYTECEILRNLRHRNLTKIISSCSNDNFKALILEYMPNGSLEKWLYSENLRLDAIQRLNIMIDVASALEYLHHGYHITVVHCDLKPSNVLLDKDMVARISDFGIAKLLDAGENVAQTRTLATLGYIAPEYGRDGLVSSKCDVYSYGILLMEVFTRKRPDDDMFNGNLSLKRWISDALETDEALVQVIDADLWKPSELKTSERLKCFSSIMNLALKCTLEIPRERMDMEDVVASLKKIKLQFLQTLE